MSNRLASALAVLAFLAACASTAPSRALSNQVPAQPPPPPMPEALVIADFTAMVEHKVLAPIALPEHGRAEISVFDGGPRLEGRTVRVTNAMPGGWSESTYVDGANRVWIVQRTNRITAPPNVIISATRVFETTLELPDGYELGGVIRLVDRPDELPPLRRAPGPEAPRLASR